MAYENDPQPPHSSAAERRAPSDLEAERMVLATILVEPSAMAKVAAILVTPADFFARRHQTMYRAMLALDARQVPITPITLGHEIWPGQEEGTDAQAAEFQEVGGQAYFAQLTADLPTTVGVEYSAEIVQRCAKYRGVIDAAGQMAELAYDAPVNLAASLDRIEDMVLGLREREKLGRVVALRDLLSDFLGPTEEAGEEGKAGSGPRTGYHGLDKLLADGLKRSDLAVVAARPSVGKSALALGIARNVAVGQGGRVLIFSLEMAAWQVATRLVAAEAEVVAARLPHERHTDVEEGRISRAIGVLSRGAVYIDDTPGSSIANIRATARRVSAASRLDLVVVDHMQLVHSDRGGRDNRVVEMSYVSRTLKEIARDLDVPVVALSQLSRAIEQRPDHIPLLSDLRDSGSIEQDADVVIFIHRPEVYAQAGDWERLEGNERGLRRPAQLIIAKHRNGPLGSVNVRFRRELAKFEDLVVYADDESAAEVGAPESAPPAANGLSPHPGATGG